MNTLKLAVVVLGASTTLRASEVVHQIQWANINTNGEIRVVSAEDEDVHVMIENAATSPKTVSLWSTSRPNITQSKYAVRGRLKYDITDGEAYVELLSYLQDPQPYFSRTLGPVGPSRGLTGSSDWREFILPFYINDGIKRSATRLDLNVHLPGRGKIWLGPLELVQYEDDEYPKSAGAWWSDHEAGIYGGIGGAVLGCLGGLLGILAGLGRARPLASLLLKLFFVTGAISFIGGIVAVTKAQPYAVYYPLLLIGVLGTVLPLTQFKAIKKRYESLELRKMQASDMA